MKFVKDIITKTADEIIKDAGVDMKYMVGTMIEVPRAALLADEIATEAEFLLVWYERPDADDIRLLARRRG